MLLYSPPAPGNEAKIGKQKSCLKTLSLPTTMSLFLPSASNGRYLIKHTKNSLSQKVCLIDTHNKLLSLNSIIDVARNYGKHVRS